MLCVGVGAPQQTHFLPEPSGFATSMAPSLVEVTLLDRFIESAEASVAGASIIHLTAESSLIGMTSLRIVIPLQHLCLSMIFLENQAPPIGSKPEGKLLRIMLCSVLGKLLASAVRRIPLVETALNRRFRAPEIVPELTDALRKIVGRDRRRVRQP